MWAVGEGVKNNSIVSVLGGGTRTVESLLLKQEGWVELVRAGGKIKKC